MGMLDYLLYKSQITISKKILNDYEKQTIFFINHYPSSYSY